MNDGKSESGPLGSLRPEVVWQRREDGPGFLFNGLTGGVFGLNTTAEIILEGLSEGKDPAALLVEKFEVEPLTARQDVEAFLDLLKEHDLVAR